MSDGVLRVIYVLHLEYCLSGIGDDNDRIIMGMSVECSVKTNKRLFGGVKVHEVSDAPDYIMTKI